MRTVELWAWVYTKDRPYPIISIEETREEVAKQKRNAFYPTIETNAFTKDKAVLKIIGETNRKLFKDTKVVKVKVIIP